jgi:DNA polymerase III gamma/tau subunit
VIEAEKGWELLNLYDKESDYFNNNNWSGGKKKEKVEEENDNEDWWEFNKLGKIIEDIDNNKKAMREKEEERKVEHNRSRWTLKAQDLEKKQKEKENEKETQKKEEETEAEKAFRQASERSLGRQQWWDQINRMMTGRPEPRVRLDATDSPLSSNREEGEVDYLPQPGQPGEEWEVKTIIIIIIICNN